MSRGVGYEIAGRLFRTQKAVVHYIRAMVARYADGERLCPDDRDFMLALLLRHPSTHQKQGSGVIAMEVRQNPIYPTSRGFWLIRQDGSETDFSYYECLRPTTHLQRFLRALRVAIEPETQAYRRAFFGARAGVPYHCPYTGEIVEFKGAHIDHQAPETFEVLAQRFVTSEHLDITTVRLDGKATDNVVQDTLADPELRERWIAYHRVHARLQVVSRTANLSLLKRRTHTQHNEEDA